MLNQTADELRSQTAFGWLYGDAGAPVFHGDTQTAGTLHQAYVDRPRSSPVRIFDRVREQLGDYKRQHDSGVGRYENVPAMYLDMGLPFPSPSLNQTMAIAMMR